MTISVMIHKDHQRQQSESTLLLLLLCSCSCSCCCCCCCCCWSLAALCVHICGRLLLFSLFDLSLGKSWLQIFGRSLTFAFAAQMNALKVYLAGSGSWVLLSGELGGIVRHPTITPGQPGSPAFPPGVSSQCLVPA